MFPEDLERLCREAIDRHVERGGLISFGAYGKFIHRDDVIALALTDNCGCALSIATMAFANEKSIRVNDHDSSYYTILSVLELSGNKADQFIAGFDGVDVDGAVAYQNDSSLSDWMLVGKRIRDYVMENHRQSVRSKPQ
jgi:hypothetical protein